MSILMELFNKDGSYNFREFVGPSGTWRIVGTEESDTIKTSLDTFKSDKGEEKTYKREQVIKQYKLGNIKPVSTSLITFRSITKKEREHYQSRRTDQ